MNREQNARAIDLEDVVDVTPESSGVEPDLPHAADAIGPGAIGEAIAETGGQVVGFVSRFHAAAEVQGRAHADLGARLDRLEDGQDVRDLQQMMRELHGTLTELVSETAKSIIRIEDRILSVTETVAALESSMESSNCAFRHLSVSAHEKIAGLDGQVNSTLQRVEQGEQSAAERIAGLDEQLNFVVQRAAKSEQSAAEKIDLLGNRFAEEQKETRALGEHLRQAERQIANFLPLDDGRYLKVGGGRTREEVAKFSARDANRLDAYNYLPQSVDEFPSGEALAERMRAAGVNDVQLYPLTLGVATLYVGNK